MNKYASGYSMISVITAIGWMAILISVIGGIAIVGQGGDFSVEIGVTIGVAGAIQGLLLVGMGSVGLAILDGSQSQQRTEVVMLSIKGALLGEKSTVADPLQPIAPPEESKASVETVDAEPVEPEKIQTDSRVAKILGLSIHNISEGAVMSKEPFFDKRGRMYSTYFTISGRVRIAKGADVLEFESIESLKDYFEVME